MSILTHGVADPLRIRGFDLRPSFRAVSRGLLVIAAAIGAGVAPSAAYDGPEWSPFRDAFQVMASNRSYEREFVREWEANPAKGLPTLSPANIEATKAAIKRYANVVKIGGWRALPDVQMQAGTNDPAVALLRQRLMLSGDLKETALIAEHFDYSLENAVKRFQASNGLPPSGIVDKRTIAALNVPATARLRQLEVNLGRLQELARSIGKRYVVVNIPAAQIEAVENDKVVSRHAGVVGKIDRPTPVLRSAIHQMNFNPEWILPPTVIEKDLIPKGRELQRVKQSVLIKYGIDAYDGNGRKLDPAKLDWNSGQVQGLQYRQQPGKDNPLGFLKINFHNSYSVYMHDTPSESLFGRNFRAASSGCVRVQGIEQLAAWLLADDGWSLEKIVAMKESGERRDVRLKRPVPLYFAYITAWATPDGVVQFRRDLYQKDGLGAKAADY
ncbi:MAG TPA: L,D-transpeptidase family protein [Hyphomicrobiaceae bacterium]|nr:L,D-transpeptidase family protein [Hyphomicrobiaceae bacterium]